MRAFHTAVVGDSGEGKTTLLREIHDNFDGYSVWIDHDGVEGIDGRQGEGYVTVDSVRGLKAAQGTRIRFRCDGPKEAVANVREHLRGVYERTGYPVQVIVDEAQNAMPEGEDHDSGNQLAAMLHEDRDKGVKVVVGSQDPQDLARGPVKQCRYMVWVGVPHPNHKGFARYYNLLSLDMPEERFKYVVWEKGPNFEYQEAYRGETKASFG